MSSKGKSDQDIILKVGDNTVQKQCEVAEILAGYFKNSRGHWRHREQFLKG